MTAVYIHGTNGSGKTTLARALMCCVPGVLYECTVGDAVVTGVMRLGMPDVLFIGKYRGPTGGLDTVQPFAEGIKAAIVRGQEWNNPIVMESLVTPGVDTCRSLHMAMPTTFFWLDTPLEQCIRQMNERRAARGSEPLEDLSNVEKKAASVASWARRLTEAGMRVERGPWYYVFQRCREILDLPLPTDEELLC